MMWIFAFLAVASPIMECQADCKFQIKPPPPRVVQSDSYGSCVQENEDAREAVSKGIRGFEQILNYLRKKSDSPKRDAADCVAEASYLNGFLSQLAELAQFFKIGSPLTQKISRLAEKINLKADLQQETYDLIAELYRILAPEKEFDGSWEGEEKDPLLGVLDLKKVQSGPNGRAERIKEASESVAAIITQTMIFAERKAPAVFKCLTTSKGSIYKTQYRDLFGEKKHGLAYYDNEIDKDLNRSYDSLMLKERDGSFRLLGEIYPRGSSEVSDPNKGFKAYSKLMERVRDQSRQGFFRKAWNKLSFKNKGVMEFPSDTDEDLKRAYYLLYHTTQASGVSLAADITLGRYFNKGLGSRTGLPIMTDYWSLVDPARAKVEKNYLFKSRSTSNRIYAYPAIMQTNTTCKSLSNCEKQKLEIHPLPFAEPKALKKTLGLYD